MRTMFAFLLGSALFCFTTYARAEPTEFECLTEAVLAESTLSKEPLVGDQIVAYSIYLHSKDGRWGKNICETINMRYPHIEYRVEKIRKHGRTRTVRTAYTHYVYDYSYKGMPYYRDIVEKSRPEMVARARMVAAIQLAGGFEPPQGFEDAIDYLYPEKSSEAGKLWFACTGKPLGKVDPASQHVMYREQTDAELSETAAAKPECRRYIKIFSEDRNHHCLKRQFARIE